MLLDKTYQEIANEFIGDADSLLYEYKTGPELVDFFNQYYDMTQVYYNEFPSRWFYVSEQLKEFANDNNLESFFDIILSSKYLRVYEGFNRNDVREAQKKRLKRLNDILDKEDMYIFFQNEKSNLLAYHEEQNIIGEGGFAKVYEVSSGVVKKVLNPEYRNDASTIHRFKREFEIAKSLQSLDHIIRVRNFNENDLSHEMNYCEYNLHDYISHTNLTFKDKIKLVVMLVSAISEIHKVNVVHRDITPYNIMIDNEKIYITDFGIAKDIDVQYTHLTINTHGIGTPNYVSPEQLSGLSQATTSSDSYSLGKCINYIFNKNPNDNNHILKSITTIACLHNQEHRFNNAIELEYEMLKVLEFQGTKGLQSKMKDKILKREYDEEVNNFIHSLDIVELLDLIAVTKNSVGAIINVMQETPSIAYNMLTDINNNMTTGYSYSDYYNFSDIAMEVLNNEKVIYDYSAQIQAARLLYYVAYNVNRFNSQDRIRILINRGIDPLIEDELTRK